ncbi:MAG: NADH-quinone oxidoreductase subunit L [Anaerolineae bacterium]
MIDWTNANFLPWLIPVPPLLAAALIFLVMNRSWVLTTITALTATFISWVMAIAILLRGIGAAFGEALGGSAFGSTAPWMDLGSTQFEMGVLVDPLTVAMLFMVPMAIMMIMIYSVGYMEHDPRRERFFGYMTLFAGAMLTLVVADNLLLLFIGWEVMGFCSYSLIGFWFEKESAYKAGVKAFMTTRVADVIMLLGIAYLFAETGTLSFRAIFFNEEILHQLASTPALLFGGMSAAGLIGVFLVIGTIGKSAQFPLHVWLPDAMEGPTPVSAMIHAAAMVSAGVYMVIRMYPLFEAGADPHHGVYSAPLLLMAFVGGFTALFAAVIAVAQYDIKRVLAYSTISQLGFMIAALGIGAYIAAAFHLITHGIFKALLFMSSGAVIHAMEHGEHHVHEHGHHPHNTFGDPEAHFDPQDMRNMGGLKSRIPVTWYAFLAGGMALAGFPIITAGFWSKDEIFAEAWYLGFGEGFGPAMFVFVMLVLAAFLTAFYTTRQLAMTFAGEPRTESAEHAGLGGPTTVVSTFMQGPLIVLGIGAVVAGFIGVPQDFPLLGWLFSRGGNPFHDFVGGTLMHHPPTLTFNVVPVLFSFAVALGGIYVGYLTYWRKPLEAGQTDPAQVALDRISPALWQWMHNKFYVDELYQRFLVTPSNWLSEVFTSQILDRLIIDGVLHTVARVAAWLGELFKRFNRVVIDGVGDGIPQGINMFAGWMRRVQTGNVQQYMLMAVLAALVIFLSAAGLLVEISPLVVLIALGGLVVVIVVLNLIGRAWGGMAE